jgi:hypothetical protein
MEWLVSRARQLGADFASRTVNKVNEDHYNRIMKLAHTTGSGWVYAGDIWWPMPGHGYFVYPFEKEEEDGEGVEGSPKGVGGPESRNEEAGEQDPNTGTVLGVPTNPGQSGTMGEPH